MQQTTCPNCQKQNRPGTVFCENCGSSLIGKSPILTKGLGIAGTTVDLTQSPASPAVSTIGPMSMFPATSAAPATPSIEAFPEGGTLQVMVEGSIEPVLLKPKAELILGRKDPATGASPDIDLTPYAGYRMGVSRRHAAIRTGDKGQLDLWDLGSSNGTFLNGTRLVAYRAYTLNSGDEIRLGQMGMKVAFIRQTK